MARTQDARDTSLYARRDGVIVSTRCWLPDAAGLAELEVAWRPSPFSAAPAAPEGADSTPRR